MSYEEMDYINSLSAPRGAARCRREWIHRMAIQWGGWALAALILVAEVAARVFGGL